MLALSRRDLFRFSSAALLQAPPGTVTAPPPPATFAEGPAFRRVTLEMSLKPFRRIDDASVRAVCRHIFRQWDALLRRVDSVAVMLWTADGSEILEYRGRMDDEIEWARYIGIGSPPKNPPGGDPQRKGLHAQPRLYMENPPRITYGDLRRIVAIIKATGREVNGKPVTVGATFDPGPEFANSRFKYLKHPEITPAGTMGPGTWVTCTARLNADKEVYAGFPGRHSAIHVAGHVPGTAVRPLSPRSRLRLPLALQWLWLLRQRMERQGPSVRRQTFRRRAGRRDTRRTARFLARFPQGMSEIPAGDARHQSAARPGPGHGRHSPARSIPGRLQYGAAAEFAVGRA